MDYSSHCGNCVFEEDPVTGQLVPRSQDWRTQASKAGISLGGGLKIAVHDHLSIRPELFIMDTTAGSGWNWNWVRLRIGIGLHL